MEKDKKKIAILERYFYPFEGGIETFTLSLAKHLVKKGHNVHVFTCNDPKGKKVENVFGITVHRYPFFKLINENFFCFYKDLKKLDPDVIHTQLPAPWIHLNSLVYKIFNPKVKLIPTYHAKIVSSKLGKILGNIFDKIFFFPFKGKYHKLVYTYSNLGPKFENSMIIPTGIDEKRFKKSKTKKEFDLIYVGRMENYKRIEWIIMASKELGLKAVIIGDGPHLEKLKEINKQINGDTEFLGNIENSKINKYYQKSKIFVLPSKSEGMPITILESLASEIPVLANKVGGIPTILKEKFLFANYQEMKNKIKNTLKEKPLVKLNKKYYQKNVIKEYEKEIL